MQRPIDGRPIDLAILLAMNWLLRLTGTRDIPVTETSQEKPLIASRVITLDPDLAECSINLLDVDGAWIAKSYPSRQEANADLNVGSDAILVSSFDLGNCDVDLDIKISSADLRAAGFALKDQLGVIVPRLLMARPRMVTTAKPPKPLPPLKGEIEIWTAKQSFDPESPTRGEWTLKRLMPAPRIQLNLSCSNEREELPEQVVSCQAASVSFLFIENAIRTQHVPLAVRQAMVGIHMSGLRPGEACAAFRDSTGSTYGCFLRANGTLSAWSSQSAAPWFVDSDADDDRRCFTLRFNEVPVAADLGRAVDAPWIARAGDEAAGSKLLEFLPYITTSRGEDTPWNTVSSGVRDRAAERELKAIAQIAVASDPHFADAELHIVAQLPPDPGVGRVRFAANSFAAFGIQNTNHASNHRLALILNLAARNIDSWQRGADKTFTIAVDGSNTAHELMSASAKLADWWQRNRQHLPESWFEVSPSGFPTLRSVVAELDAAGA